MSNFQKVKKMNEIFGKGSVGWDWPALEKQFHLVVEEFKETHDAIEAKDRVEVVDGACDLLVVVYGLLHLSGVDADAAFAEVMSSNMSKVCTTAEDTYKTLDKYVDLDVNVSVEGNLPECYIRVNEDCYDKNGKFYPRGKFLKSILWKEPELEQFTKD